MTIVQEPENEKTAGADKQLILESLEIKNFRAFRHLTIEKLGRVNLITGKNSVGKSSLLEALLLYTRRSSVSVIRSLLITRDEYRPRNDRYDGRGIAQPSLFSFEGNEISNELQGLRSLLYGRPELHQSISDIEIGPNNSSEHLQIKFEWLVAENDSAFGETRYVNPTEDDQEGHESALFLTIAFDGATSTLPVERILRVSRGVTNGPRNSTISVQYVPVGGLAAGQIGAYYDKIALTSLEEDVIAALQLVANDVQRISLVGDSEVDRFSGRIGVIKLDKFNEPVPLKSLGDGANRLFGVVLALVNARDGVLLLDEIENGLHYSVLPDVWRLIFKTARRLNVQVFATTHSRDCIEAFQEAAAEDESDGVLIRLKEVEGEIKAIAFDEQELRLIIRQQIEVR